MMTLILFFRYWPDVPYIDIEKGVDLTSNMFQNLDYIASVCPCAGLSMLNTSRGTKARSADAEQNQWMYKSSDFILDKIKPKVSTCIQTLLPIWRYLDHWYSCAVQKLILAEFTTWSKNRLLSDDCKECETRFADRYETDKFWSRTLWSTMKARHNQ